MIKVRTEPETLNVLLVVKLFDAVGDGDCELGGPWVLYGYDKIASAHACGVLGGLSERDMEFGGCVAWVKDNDVIYQYTTGS